MFSLSVVTRDLDDAAARAAAAVHALAAGQREHAEAEYAEAARVAASRPAQVNLSALAYALRRFDAAAAHARDALRLRRGDIDATINLAAADWRLGRQRDAALALSRVLAVRPGHALAAQNYARMFHRIGRFADARQVLERALAAGAREPQLHLDLCSVHCRLGAVDAARVQALLALEGVIAGDGHGSLSPLPDGRDKASRRMPSAEDWLATVIECARRLEPLDVGYCFTGGLARMFALQGNLEGARKDVDIAVDGDSPLPAIEAAFAEGFRRYTRPGQEIAGGAGERAIGLVHEATGIPVDLFFQERTEQLWRGVFGAPDWITVEYPAFAIRPHDCPGMPLPLRLPEPLEEHVRLSYGDEWREEFLLARGERIPRAHALPWLRFPALSVASYPLAFVRGLQGLASVLAQRDLARARSACLQLLAREELPELQSALAWIERAQHAGDPLPEVAA